MKCHDSKEEQSELGKWLQEEFGLKDELDSVWQNKQHAQKHREITRRHHDGKLGFIRTRGSQMGDKAGKGIWRHGL